MPPFCKIDQFVFKHDPATASTPAFQTIVAQFGQQSNLEPWKPFTKRFSQTEKTYIKLEQDKKHSLCSHERVARTWSKL